MTSRPIGQEGHCFFSYCVGVSQPVVSKVLDAFVNSMRKMHRSSFICPGQDVKERKRYRMPARLTTFSDLPQRIKIIRYFRPSFFLFSTRLSFQSKI